MKLIIGIACLSHVCDCDQWSNGYIWGSSREPTAFFSIGGGVHHLQLLQPYGGVHTRIYWACSGAIFWEMDMRVVRGSNQGRDCQKQKAHQHRRSHEDSHELLQQVQDCRSAYRSNASLDHGHKADYDEEFGVEVHTEQPSSEVADSRSCIESIGELLPCLNGLSESLYNQEWMDWNGNKWGKAKNVYGSGQSKVWNTQLDYVNEMYLCLKNFWCRVCTAHHLHIELDQVHS